MGVSLCSANDSEQTHLHKGEQSSEETDDCSPLCSCSCCQSSSTTSLLSFAVKSKFTILVKNTPKSLYQNNYSQQYLDSIWQPPKFNFTV